ncbi:MAG: hypothetical protein ACREIU_01615 [Planctomycetota bacterium]
MIEDTLTRKKTAAITSDRWHVVQACWSAGEEAHPPFARRIVSEHEDRGHAVAAAEILGRYLIGTTGERPAEERDQVFVRPPRYKSLKFAHRRKGRAR